MNRDLIAAIQALRDAGHNIVRGDFPPEPLPGLYYIDGRELTERQVVDYAARGARSGISSDAT